MTKMIIINLIISPSLKHPISLGSMLIAQTIFISIYMSKASKSSWFAYILFITMIGGMMIMFMYMASIASNEKFHFNLIYLMIIITMLSMFFPMSEDQTLEFLNKLQSSKMLLMENEETKTLSKFFNSSKNKITIILMIILLLMMIVVTNISSTFEGPLKKTYV